MKLFSYDEKRLGIIHDPKPPLRLDLQITKQALKRRISAIIPNRPKYPISAERLTDGRSYEFSADSVAAYLKASGD